MGGSASKSNAPEGHQTAQHSSYPPPAPKPVQLQQQWQQQLPAIDTSRADVTMNIAQKAPAKPASQEYSPDATQRRDVNPQPSHSQPPAPEPMSQTPSKNKGPKKVDFVGQQTDGSALAAALPKAPLSVPEECQSWIPILGESAVRNLVSDDWKDREAGLNAVGRFLSNSGVVRSKNTDQMWRVVTEVLTRAVKEKVAPLYYAGLELLTTAIGTFSMLLSPEHVKLGLDMIVPAIVYRCGNNNSRIQEQSIQTLISIATQPNLGLTYLGGFLLAPIVDKKKDKDKEKEKDDKKDKKNESTGTSVHAQLQGRLEAITALLAALKTLGGIHEDNMFAFVKPALEHPDEKVRRAAIRVVAEVYRIDKAAGKVLKPEDRLGPLKPALLEVMKKALEEVDQELSTGAVPVAKPALFTEEMPVGMSIATSKHLPPMKATGSLQQALGHLPPIGANNNNNNRLSDRNNGIAPPREYRPTTARPRTSVPRGSSLPPLGKGSRNMDTSDGGLRPSKSYGGPMKGTMLNGWTDDDHMDLNEFGMDGKLAFPPPRPKPKMPRPYTQGARPYTQGTSRDYNSAPMYRNESALDDTEERLIEYILNDIDHGAAGGAYKRGGRY